MNNINYDAHIIGSIILAERKALKLSQEDLSEKLDCARQTVAKWEKGEGIPLFEHMLKMCNIFDCELGYLLGEYECKTRAITDICAETGLSEKAVENLIGTNKYCPTRTTKALNYILENEQMWEFFARKTESIEGKNLLANIGNYFICADSDTFFVHSPGSRCKEVCGYDTLAMPKENAFMNIGALVNRVRLDSVLETLKKMKKDVDMYRR